ncbi:MAG: precorrin-2 C(20)-methyltransferase [Actinomycetota bacterium]|nr:precorrin-2 C(20)-methyltransferase [Actinomycetota bacterium]
MNSLGKLYGVGIGPGDTELLTIKAVNVLNSVEVIFTPRAAPTRDSIARKIIEPVLDNKKKIKELTFPMTKQKEELEYYWAEAASEVENVLKEGKNAAFVTLGDPFLYSTFIYLYRKIRERNPLVEIVTLPGISSIFASASAAGIPIASGSEKVAIIPLSRDVNQIKPYLDMFDTIFILKVGDKLQDLVDLLSRLELADKSVLVQKVSQAGLQRVIRNLPELREDELREVGYLSTVIVKKA